MSPRNLLRPAMLPTLALTAALIGAAGRAAAAAPASDAPATPATVTAGTPSADAAAAQAQAQAQAPAAPVVLTPLHQEIRTLLEQQRAEVDALTAKIAAERDPLQLVELQRAVEASKRKVQVGILEAQLRFARAEGKAAAVTALEAALNEVQHPDVAAKPVDRPATAAAPGAH